jgi:hypothetical protein
MLTFTMITSWTHVFNPDSAILEWAPENDKITTSFSCSVMSNWWPVEKHLNQTTTFEL